MKNQNILLISTLILFAAFSRLIPHWPNFTAIGAMALFGGALLPKNSLRFLIPLLALFISDLVINNLVYSSTSFQWFTEGFYWMYGSFAVICLLTPLIINKIAVKNVVLGALFSSTLFFLVTNFGVWAGMYNMYPKTFDGLLMAYTAGLPFFANSLSGDLFFSGVLFTSYFLATKKLIAVKA